MTAELICCITHCEIEVDLVLVSFSSGRSTSRGERAYKSGSVPIVLVVEKFVLHC